MEHYPKLLVNHVRPLVFLCLNQNCAEDLVLESEIFNHLNAARLVNLKVIGDSENINLKNIEQNTNKSSEENLNENTIETTFNDDLNDPNDPLNVNNPNNLNSVTSEINEDLDQQLKEENLYFSIEKNYTYYNQSLNIPTLSESKSYFNYKPKGILPRAWMHNVSEKIPAVVILGGFIKDINGLDNISDKINQIRETKRDIKIAIVIRKSSELDLETQNSFELKLKDLKIDGKLYFQIQSSVERNIQASNSRLSLQPSSDILTSLGLSRNIYDSAVIYYHDLIKKLKLKTQSTVPAYLNVRIYFKIGFYEEIISNRKKSFEYYYKSYTELMNISTQQYTEREIKILGDYINFKLSMLKLIEKKVEEAVKQFSKHIQWFSSMINERENERQIYEHYYFIYRQNRMFGTFLQTFIEKGIKDKGNRTDIQDTNGINRNKISAFYFLAAAEAAKERRFHSERLCNQHKSLITSLYNLSGNEKYKIQVDSQEIVKLPFDLHIDEEITQTEGFYGQEISYLSLEEKQLIESSKIPNLRQIARELNFDHSTAIQKMLELAFFYYQPVKIEHQRLVYSILYKTALELENSNLWNSALKYYEYIVSILKEEKWYDLLTDVYLHIIKCSIKEKDTLKVISAQLPLLSTRTSITIEEKKNILKFIKDCFDNKTESSLPKLNETKILEYNQKDFIFSAKAYFEEKSSEIYSETNLIVEITSTSVFSFQFSRLQVIFNNSKYEIKLQNGEINLEIKPEAITYIRIPMIFTEVEEIDIKYIYLYIGDNPNCIYLKWNQISTDYNSKLKFFDERDEDLGSKPKYPVHKVKPPIPKLTIDFNHVPPVIIGEIYPINLNIRSNGVYIKEGNIKIEKSDFIKFYNSNFEETTTFNFGEVEASSSTNLVIYLKQTKTGISDLFFNVLYNIENYNNLKKVEQFNLECIDPFELELSIHPTRSTSSENVSVLRRDSKWNQKVGGSLKMHSFTPTLFSFNLKCVTEYNIQLMNVRFVESNSIESIHIRCLHPDYYIFENDKVQPLIFKGDNPIPENALNLSNNDEVTVIFMLQVDSIPNHLTEKVVPGKLLINCKRLGLNNLEIQGDTITIPLPTIDIHSFPISFSVDYPDSARVFETFEVKLLLQNNTSSTQKVDLSIEENNLFVMNGTSNVSQEIIPFETSELFFIFSPVECGYLTIPKIQIKCAGVSLHLDSNEEWKIFVQDI